MSSASQRSDLTLAQARDIRARAWRYVYDCYEKKLQVKAAGGGGGENQETKESKYVSRNSSIHDN